jgi:o-succinylbenzoate---CoA ligase
MTNEISVTIGYNDLKRSNTHRFFQNSEHELLRELGDFLTNWYDSSEFILQKTSGSTGKAKKLKISKKAMLASAQLTLKTLEIANKKKVLLCLPLQYIAGKMMVVRALAGQHHLVIQTPTNTPQNLMNNFALTAMVPLQLKNLVAQKVSLSGIQNILIGGATLDQELENQIQDLPSAIYETYGMAETCSHIALRRANGPQRETDFKLLDGIDAQINNEGQLIISAPHLGLNEFQTSDLAEITGPRTFKWLGRADHIINSGGIKINPIDIEREVEPILALQCVVLGLPHPTWGQELVLVVETMDKQMSEETVMQSIQSHLSSTHRPKRIVFMNEFPKNESMKTDRISIYNSIRNQLNSDL